MTLTSKKEDTNQKSWQLEQSTSGKSDAIKDSRRWNPKHNGDLSGQKKLEYDETSDESSESPRKPLKKSSFSLSKNSAIDDE